MSMKPCVAVPMRRSIDPKLLPARRPRRTDSTACLPQTVVVETRRESFWYRWRGLLIPVLAEFILVVLFAGFVQNEITEARRANQARQLAAQAEERALQIALTSRDLRGVVLRSEDLSGISLASRDLSSADLSGSSLIEVNLSNANLSNANLSNANLSNANLTGADLTGADLTGADLTGALLTGGTLAGATLTGTILADTDLTNATLTGTGNTGAKWDPYIPPRWPDGFDPPANAWDPEVDG